jgi:hypothetical protein
MHQTALTTTQLQRSYIMATANSTSTNLVQDTLGNLNAGLYDLRALAMAARAIVDQLEETEGENLDGYEANAASRMLRKLEEQALALANYADQASLSISQAHAQGGAQ